jgi:hypothetical protein
VKNKKRRKKLAFKIEKIKRGKEEVIRWKDKERRREFEKIGF